MFNNNTYTDFRTAYKHILIPSYIIQVIYQNQNVTKLFGWNRPRLTFENWALPLLRLFWKETY